MESCTIWQFISWRWRLRRARTASPETRSACTVGFMDGFPPFVERADNSWGTPALEEFIDDVVAGGPPGLIHRCAGGEQQSHDGGKVAFGMPPGGHAAVNGKA